MLSCSQMENCVGNTFIMNRWCGLVCVGYLQQLIMSYLLEVMVQVMLQPSRTEFASVIC